LKAVMSLTVNTDLKDLIIITLKRLEIAHSSNHILKAVYFLSKSLGLDFDFKIRCFGVTSRRFDSSLKELMDGHYVTCESLARCDYSLTELGMEYCNGIGRMYNPEFDLDGEIKRLGEEPWWFVSKYDKELARKVCTMIEKEVEELKSEDLR
jgi:hypothetical protein